MQRLMWATTVYVVVLGAFAVWRWHIWSYGEDTGGFTQIVLNAFHGFYSRMELRSHFGAHWSPILATLYPLVAITRSGLSLQIIQVVLAASAAFPIYLIVRRHASDSLAFRCALLALLYPPLIGVATSEFHEIAFFPVTALWLAWAADSARPGWFVFFTIAALLIREDVCLLLLLIGIGLMVHAAFVRNVREAYTGATLALPAGLTLWLYFGVVTQRFGGWPFSSFYQYPFAHGPAALAWATIAHPVTVAMAVFTLGRLGYTLEALAPLAFLPLRSWWSLLALPGFVEVTFSSDPGVWRMGSHYGALWIPGLLLGGCRALLEIEKRLGTSVAQRWSAAAIAASLIVLAAFDPVHPLYWQRAAYPDRENAARAMTCVPQTASVSTWEEWYSRFAGLYPAISPNVDPSSQYLVYPVDFDNGVFRSHVQPAMSALLADHRYVVACRFGNVVTYRRAP